MNINLLAPMYLSQAVLPSMISKGSGNIINISSIWGETGASCEVVYSTTKGGLNLFTKSLALVISFVLSKAFNSELYCSIIL